MESPIVVVGGGASGMMAAGCAAACGAPVLLLEKNERLGAKLRITGKGRCNLTNDTDLDDFVAHFGVNGRFLYRAFSRFFHPELRVLLAHHGVPTLVERGRRVFPVSNEARQVVRVFKDYLEENRVKIRYGASVRRLLVQDKRILGVETVDGERILAPIVVLATGGASYPSTGSTGDGYLMAQELGHHIIRPRPALIPLLVKEGWVSELQGLSLYNVRASLYLNDDCLAQEFGEMIFTHFGVSGPIILTLSKRAVESLGRGRVQIAIDFKPALSDDQLEARLRRDLDEFGRRDFRNLLKELLPLRLRDVFIQLTGIPGDKPGHQLSAEERQQLFRQLRDTRMTITGARPLAEAIITAGGVDVKEIEPRTMESKLIQGLYFCGETMDIDADTGGYNLQAAFSTGFLAGESAAAAWRVAVAQAATSEQEA
jgi:hypothetical protein